MRAGFEGGQMPIYMRLGKQRGSTSKDAMPIGPFRTATVPVNVSALDRFEAGAEVTPELLVEAGVIKNTRVDVKVLGGGEITKKLTVRVHAISASAREKIERAGGTVDLLRAAKRPGARGNREVPSTESEGAKGPVRAKRGPVEGARGNREVPSTSAEEPAAGEAASEESELS